MPEIRPASLVFGRSGDNLRLPCRGSAVLNLRSWPSGKCPSIRGGSHPVARERRGPVKSAYMEIEDKSSAGLETILDGSRFVRACLRKPVDRTPVWFLRQAGRYMQEYRDVRKHHTLVEICKQPELAAEVTITAAEKLGVDAAIIFADLLLPLEPMGLPFRVSGRRRAGGASSGAHRRGCARAAHRPRG